MGKEGREDGWAGMALWQSLGEDDGFGYDDLSFLALWSGEDGLEGDRESPESLEMLPLPSCETLDLLPLWVSAYSKFIDQNWFNIYNIFLLL